MNLPQELDRNPGNWPVRARLVEERERAGDIAGAIDLLLAAPQLPTERRHLALGARLLANVQPQIALQYVRRMGESAAPAPAAGARVEVRPLSPHPASGLAAPPPTERVPQIFTAGAIPAAAVDAESPGAPAAGVAVADAEAHYTPPRRKGFGVLTASILLHVALLFAAGFWVVYTILPEKKDDLQFTSERPSTSANKKAAEHEVKLARKKNMGAAPTTKRIATTAAANISIPAITENLVSDFNPRMMGSGAGMGFGGFGSGAGGGGGMGLGGGGGRIKFFGFEGDASSIILAIDTSGSMVPSCGGEAGIAKLREEIGRTVNSLSAMSRFNIICFGQQADACFPINVPATPDNKARAILFMEGYYGPGDFGRTRTEKLMAENKGAMQQVAEVGGVKFTPVPVNSVKGLENTSGGSRMDLALVAAMERRPQTIFLLSDGKPGTARDGQPLSQDDLVKFIRENYQRIYRNAPLTIHTIYTNTDKSEEDFMKKISREFKGKHKDVQLG